jgi:hypothetical protein
MSHLWLGIPGGSMFLQGVPVKKPYSYARRINLTRNQRQLNVMNDISSTDGERFGLTYTYMETDSTPLHVLT